MLDKAKIVARALTELAREQRPAFPKIVADLLRVEAGNTDPGILGSEHDQRIAFLAPEPRLGREEGYPLVMLTPEDSGIRVSGFHAQKIGDYLREGWALLTRKFREGPRDDLGLVEQVTLASTDGEPFGVLLDGEKVESPAEEVFRLVPCEVDLLATVDDGR